MKKLILVLTVCIAGYAVSAQETIIYRTSSTGTYNAYSVPAPIRINYQTVYGDPTLVTWESMNGWWYTTNKSTDNRIMYLYYPTDPWYLEVVPDNRDSHYSVALPVINTYVPESIITTAINNYGNSLYSITKLVNADKMESYQVGLLENGTMRTVSLKADGTAGDK